MKVTIVVRTFNRPELFKEGWNIITSSRKCNKLHDHQDEYFI